MKEQSQNFAHTTTRCTQYKTDSAERGTRLEVGLLSLVFQIYKYLNMKQPCILGVHQRERRY